MASAGSLKAEQFGLFTYEVSYRVVGGISEEIVEITDYPTYGVGEVHIPAEIDGMQVTRVGFQAFQVCTRLTSISIPDSVASIGGSAFAGCSSLASVSIPGSVASIGAGAFADCSSLASVSIGSGTTFIGANAFWNCMSLRSVSIPDSVTEIGRWAFARCELLTAVIFLGDAPSANGAFSGNQPDFAIFFLSGRSGFTSAWLQSRPANVLGAEPSPSGLWLLAYSLHIETNLNHDLNGDGVRLLMAYALDLDPNLNLRSSLPIPVVDGDTLSVSFHAASAGISYTVETSADLRNWSSDGVVLSELDAANKRTASVSLDSPRRFLRLEVSENP